MTKRIFAAILLLALFAGSASAFDAVALFGWPPADGSISTVKLDELDYIPFDITAEPPAYAEGRLFWDKDNGCLGVYPDVNGPILQVGQEFWARVKNPGVATMTNGTVVYLDPPTSGNDPVAKLAQANASATACMLGVVTHDINPDSTGFVTIQGLVRDLHNSEFTEGQRVYLSATTAGSYTASVPAAPSFPVKVGHVVKAHDGAGVLYIKQQVNGAFERAQFAAGANFNGNVLIATSTDDGSNKLQVNGPVKFQTSTGAQIFGQITLDDDESIDINTLLTGVAANCGIFKVLLESNDGYGDFYLQGPVNDVVLISQHYAAKTDSDGNICVFSAGSGNYTLKNRLGASATFVFSYIGRK